MRTDDFAVVGWSEPSGSRAGFGSLHLAQYDADGSPVYAGAVGSGFTGRQLGALYRRLARAGGRLPARAARVRPAAATTGCGPRSSSRCATRRSPRRGSCASRRSCACVTTSRRRSASGRASASPEAALAPARRSRAGAASRVRTIPFTNLDKVFWPEAGLHQGRPHRVLPRGRRLDAPLPARPAARPHALSRRDLRASPSTRRTRPNGRRTGCGPCACAARGSERDLDYFVVDDVESLLYIVNSAAHPAPRLVEPRGRRSAIPTGASSTSTPRKRRSSTSIEIARLAPRALRRDRAARVRQDERLDRPPRARAAGAPGDLRPVAHAGRAPRAGRRAGAAARSPPSSASSRSGTGKVYVDFLQNGHGQAAGGAVQHAAASRRAGVGAARLERGQARPRHLALHDRVDAAAAARDEARPARRRCSISIPTWWARWSGSAGRMDGRRRAGRG